MKKRDSTLQFLAKYRVNSETLGVFVHMEDEVSRDRIEELQQLGLTLDPESWLPPVDPHPTGFYGGEAQVSQIVQIASLSDIVKLTSAEIQVSPGE